MSQPSGELEKHVQPISGCTNEQDVDVSAEAGSVLQHLLHAAQQQAKDGLLDVLVAMDAGSQRARQLLKHILRTNGDGPG